MDDQVENGVRIEAVCVRCRRDRCNCHLKIISIDSVVKTCKKYYGEKRNFANWSEELRGHLALTTLRDVVKEAHERTEEEWQEELANDVEMNDILFGLLTVLTVGSARKLINEGKSVHNDMKNHGMKAYRILYNSVYGKKALTTVKILERIEGRRLRGTETVDDYIADLRNDFAFLEGLGEPLSDSQKVIRILKGLPATDEYKNLSTKLLVESPDDVEKVEEVLSQYEATVRTLTRRTHSYRPRAAHFTNLNENREVCATVQCWGCGQSGHIRRNCPNTSGRGGQGTQRATQRGNVAEENVEQIIGESEPMPENPQEQSNNFNRYPNRSSRGRGRWRGRGQQSRGRRHHARMVMTKFIATDATFDRPDDVDSSDVSGEFDVRENIIETTATVQGESDFSSGLALSGRAALPRNAIRNMSVKMNNLTTEEHFTANVRGLQRSFDFVIDSGATAHMTNRVEWLTEVTECNVVITAAQNSTFIANKMGTLKCKVYDDQGRLTPLTLKGVLYSEHLAANLLSVPAACDYGCDMWMFEQVFVTPSGIRIPFDRSDGLYLLRSTSTSSNRTHTLPSAMLNRPTPWDSPRPDAQESLNTARREEIREQYAGITLTPERVLQEHIKHGHVSFRKLQHMLGFNCSGKWPTCSTCTTSNLRRSPYKKVQQQALRPNEGHIQLQYLIFVINMYKIKFL